jgi:hypothetical protein
VGFEKFRVKSVKEYFLQLNESYFLKSDSVCGVI